MLWVTFTTVDYPTFNRFKRDLSFLPAIRANGVPHDSRDLEATIGSFSISLTSPAP